MTGGCVPRCSLSTFSLFESATTMQKKNHLFTLALRAIYVYVFVDSHTPVLAVEWVGTSLLIAGGRPLGSGGEEMPGGITTLEGLACDDSSKGK